jgi:hypothetical protein
MRNVTVRFLLSFTPTLSHFSTPSPTSQILPPPDTTYTNPPPSTTSLLSSKLTSVTMSAGGQFHTGGALTRTGARQGSSHDHVPIICDSCNDTGRRVYVTHTEAPCGSCRGGAYIELSEPTRPMRELQWRRMANHPSGKALSLRCVLILRYYINLITPLLPSFT